MGAVCALGKDGMRGKVNMMETRRLLSCVSVALLVGPCASAWPAQTSEAAPEPIAGLKDAKPLNEESLGEMPGKVVVDKFGPFRIPGTDDYVVLLSNYAKRGFPEVGRKVFLTSLKLRTGKLKAHPPVGALETNIHKSLLWEGKLYLLLNVPSPSALAIYDLANDTITTVEDLFVRPGNGAFSMCPAADGTIALGSAPPEISLYNTKTGEVTKCGKVGPKGAGFVYSITQDLDYIYGATRGQAPWQVVAVNKKTGKITVALEAPMGGYLHVGKAGDRCWAKASTKGKGGEVRVYDLDGGNAVVQKVAPPVKRVKREAKPEVMIDDSSGMATETAMVYWRLPEDKPAREDLAARAEKNGWRSVKVKARISGVLIHRVVTLDGKTIIANGSPYGQMLTYNTETAEFKLLGRPTNMNVYSLASDGKYAYISGYPGMPFARIDFSRPFTTDKSYPGRPGIPWTDKRANPWQMCVLGQIVAGAHCGVFMHQGGDGRMYTCGMCFRHNAGFAFGWYDPKTEKFGKVDDSMLKHQQVAWMTPVEGGRKLAVATRVQYREYKGGVAPKCGKIFLFDTAEGKFTREYEPLPDVTKLGSVAGVAGGRLVGIAPTSKRRGRSPTLTTAVYLLDLASGEVLLKRRYQGQIVGAVDKFDIPRKGHDFVTGPDGWVWTMMGRESMPNTTALLRIDPQDLSIDVVGTVRGNWNRFIFLGRDLYLGGAERLRRVRNIAPAG